MSQKSNGDSSASSYVYQSTQGSPSSLTPDLECEAELFEQSCALSDHGSRSEQLDLQRLDVMIDEQPSPSEEAKTRLRTQLQRELPIVDYTDLLERQRQFAPEYSQKAYETAKASEYALGDYLDCECSSLNISAAHRKEMVRLTQNLHS